MAPKILMKARKAYPTVGKKFLDLGEMDQGREIISESGSFRSKTLSGLVTRSGRTANDPEKRSVDLCTLKI